MAIVDFMNVSSMKGTFPSQVNGIQKSQDENLEVAEAFAGFMNQAGQALNQMADQTSSAMDTEIGDVQSVTSSYERYSYKDNQIEDAKLTTVDEKLEESVDVLKQTEEKVMDAVCEEYGVSEEEVQELLDGMGIGVLDLLNPENLVNFIMQLTGAASAEELLLDDHFLQIMGMMDNFAKGLMKELHVDANGLQELVEQMQLVQDETELPAEFKDVVENVLEQKNPESVEEVLGQQNAETAQEVLGQQNAETAQEVLGQQSAETVEEVLGQQNVETEEVFEQQNAETAEVLEQQNVEAGQNTVVIKEASDAKEDVSVETKNLESSSEVQTADGDENALNQNLAEQDAFADNQNSEGNSFLNHSANAEQMVVNQQTGVAAGQTADVSQATFASYYGTDTMQIIEQIVQQMRVTISPETTSMEMQLNPENLGKVFVRISSEEGVVNAQFHATNEAVKEALETQIATLRENLNQAGVKVDAIEVTIASHEFERNLEQNQQSSEETMEDKEVQTNKRRNISLNSLDELSGIMTEEETLVAQIMKDNGNSVDFKA